MQIRADFKEVECLLNKLVECSNAFNMYEKDWVHLKNNEDFSEIYNFPHSDRLPLEDIYAKGRGLSCISYELIQFNYSDYFATLTLFIDSIEPLIDIDHYKLVSQQAKNQCLALNNIPYATKIMIELFDKQITLLSHIKQVINSLKESEVYKWENGKHQITFPVPEYNKILGNIHATGKMLERHFRAYAGKDEETLRDNFLVSLKGVATGETFNNKGKTDILVRKGDSNEFIGECKFWKGKKSFLDTISQLLNYLSYRDTKAAVILFVPNVDFTTIINKMKKFVSEHPNYLKESGQKDETWYNYEFHMNDDPARIVNIAIMLYHLKK